MRAGWSGRKSTGWSRLRVVERGNDAPAKGLHLRSGAEGRFVATVGKWLDLVEQQLDLELKARGAAAQRVVAWPGEDYDRRRRAFAMLDDARHLVAGLRRFPMCFLMAIRHEAFTHIYGQKEFVQNDQNDLFPYLLVNIGSGVSIIKVDGEGKFQWVSRANVGHGTYRE